MSRSLINRSPDLLQLEDEGHNLEIQNGHLVITGIPYLTPTKELAWGALISPLELAGETTRKPSDHTVYFQGEFPSDENGYPIPEVAVAGQATNLGNNLQANFKFSCKPRGGNYENYHHSRNARMLESARDSYLKFTNILANENAPESEKAAREILQAAESASGFRAVVQREQLPGIQLGRSQLAWKYSRDYHKVSLSAKMPAEMLFHHILAHESLHIAFEAGARKGSANRWFISTDETLQTAIASMDRDIRKIVRSTGQSEDPLRDMLWRMLPDALSQLYNAPLDILIERRIHEEHRLRDAQFCSLCLQVHNASRVGLEARNRSIVPPALLTLNDTLNGAAALFLDNLSRGATAFFSAYHNLPTAKLARDVHDLCANHVHKPGSEYALVDEVAEMLGCSSWFTWKEDPGQFPILERFDGNFPEAGVSDPKKLKQRNAAAVPLLIKALDRLDGMDDAALKQLVMEAALAGQDGINFSDPTPAHSLKSLPGENLSGLEVMCLLYAGLKRINPSMPDSEIGMDLAREFATAQKLRNR